MTTCAGGQRGFTLIELAIVMAVVGLVLGASLAPLRALDESRQAREESRRMETVRAAVVGYALRNKTRERIVSFAGDVASSGRIQIPAGRPYLPCPDVDGDGFEDRIPADKFVQGVEAEPMMEVTIQVTVTGGRPGTAALIYGGCRTSRGTIPWRTLGVPPADGWGNRRTYFADPVFASAVFGFDGKTVADIYDRRLPFCPGLPPPLRSPVAFATGLDATPPMDGRCPAVVCSGGRTNTPADLNACAQHMAAPPARCAWHPDRVPNVVLKAGAMADEAIRGDFAFPPGGILDGVPFVIVSHGPNGRGAVNHWATLGRPTNLTGTPGPVCNRGQLTSTSAGADDILARQGRGDYWKDNHEAMNATRLAPGNSAVARRCAPFRALLSATDADGLELSPSVFVWEPPGGDYAARQFDDTLAWMTREELSLAMGGRIPASPPMVCAQI